MSALKLVLCFTVSFLALTYSFSSVKAQGVVTSQDYKAPQHSQYTSINEFHGACCEMMGKSCYPNQKCVGVDGGGKLVGYYQLPNGGALGMVNQGLLALYSPPTSTVVYLANIGNQLGIAPAYAQSVASNGGGNGVIQPVLALWQVARNLSYLAFIIIFLVVGFMIMFKQKINPQTVVTAQQALPTLVIGLVLVTFSYFITALIVDLAFVGTEIVAVFFQQSGALGSYQNSGTVNDFARDANIFTLFWAFISSGAFADTFRGLSQAFTLPPTLVQQAITGTPPGTFLSMIPVIGPIITNIVGGAAATGVGWVVGGLVAVIILLAVLIQMLRLLWELVKAYITILVLTITAPLIILIASIPGHSSTLSAWWKTVLGNVLIFPAIIGAYLFALAIMGNTQSQSFTQALPLFSGMPSGLLRNIIGLGIILGLPAVPAAVKGMLGVKDLAGGLGSAALGGAAASVALYRATGGVALGGVARDREAFSKANFDAQVGRYTGGVPAPWYTRWFNR